MSIRVSDYIANFLVANNVKDVFTVVGGGAMFLNDSLGHHPDLRCIYNHNEQASAMAADAYARVNNQMAAVCVTTGPGATNAITGVAGAYVDSIPMIVLSGQVRYDTSVYASGLKLRTRGVQEFDIIGSVSNMTKYCELVKNPEDIRYCLEKAVYYAKEGRPGPCWLDIPLNVQSASINESNLHAFVQPDKKSTLNLDKICNTILSRIELAERPVLFAGNGIRLAGAHDEFLELVEMLNIPVVTSTSSVDAIETAHPLYVGRSGGTGDRAGNFAVQNSDLFISLGSRLSFAQTGFAYKLWARSAYKIINDIDAQELEKESIRADEKICCDVLDLIRALREKMDFPLKRKSSWIEQCQNWKKKYPVVLERHYDSQKVNIYAFYHELTRRLSSDDKLVVSVGTARVAGSQASIIKKGMRFITNPTMASMGWGLPAAIGVCVANDRKKVIAVTGEGSLQMNLQELQTIIHEEFPIALFILNNGGYHSIRMTQTNFFSKNFVGIGSQSKDVSFPDISKLAWAYGYQYFKIEKISEADSVLPKVLAEQKPCICEVFMDISQFTEPKVSSKRLENGQMVSAPLEDMAPFLSRKELKENMYIPLVDEM